MNTLAFWINFGNGFEETNPPQNAMQLDIEMSFENTNQIGTLNANILTFMYPESKKINDWIKQGTTGTGGGIMEGLPLHIIETTTNTKIFDGVIDLTHSENEYAADKVSVYIKNYQLEMFDTLFDSIHYSFLAAKPSDGGPSKNINGQITSNSQYPALGAIVPKPYYEGGDFIVVPYQINQQEAYIEILTMLLAIFMMVSQLLKSLASMFGSSQGALASSVSVADFGLGTLIMLAFYLIEIVILIISIISMIESLIYLLIKPILTKFAMRADTLVLRACQYFGIGYKSTILQSYPYNNLCIMPAKRSLVINQTLKLSLLRQLGINLKGENRDTVFHQQMEYDDLFNYNNSAVPTALKAYGYYDGKPKELIEDLSVIFNAKPRIIFENGKPVLHFEVVELFETDPAYRNTNFVLPPSVKEAPFNSKGLFNNTGKAQNPFRTNANALPSVYEIKYPFDETDRNTVDYYDGGLCVVNSTINTRVGNYSMMQGAIFRDIGFSMIKRKNEVTGIEEALLNFVDFITTLLKPLFQAINKIIDAVNGINTFIDNVSGYVDAINKILPKKVKVPNPNIPKIDIGFLYKLPLNFKPDGHIDTSNPFNLPNSFTSIGHAYFEKSVFTNPKIFIIGNEKEYVRISTNKANVLFKGYEISADNRNYLAAAVLMRKYHYTKLALSKPTAQSQYNNQWLLYEDVEIPLSARNFFSLYNYNQVLDSDGNICVIQSCKWNPYKGMATISYKRKQNFCTNIKTSITYDDLSQTSQIFNLPLPQSNNYIS